MDLKQYLTEKHQNRITLACQEKFVFVNPIQPVKVVKTAIEEKSDVIKDKSFTKQVRHLF